ncbi:RNA polymerase sigma factor [Nocardia brasiliensis]|uniref:RNA polymerase sigma factor n=1 Tax=Nocardia brasiliensis TaxID=37326 RepID=UPI003796C427
MSRATEAGFEEFVRRQFEVLLRTAKRYAVYRGLPLCSAEDILATALERVWRKQWQTLIAADEGYRRATVCRYMQFIAQELAREAQRVDPLAPEQLPERAYYDIDIGDKLAAAFQLRVLAEALQGLPDKHRAVLELAALAGLSNKEIAVQVGMTATNVATVLSRARHELRSHLHQRRIDEQRLAPVQQPSALAEIRQGPQSVAPKLRTYPDTDHAEQHGGA